MFFYDSLVRVRAGTRTDRGGNEVPDWSAGAANRLTIDRLNIQPASQTEGTSTSSGAADPTRDAVTTGWRVQSEEGTRPDITALDRLEWRGMTLEVQGEVAEWSDPLTGVVHHIEFTMVRATG
ncbi:MULTISPECIES: hypothetical protein [Streptomyces]|uniref:hypothetical protein n=1 Tax=Streptomyces TaxID=1883 RepID=UPI00073DEB04|nr:hypothetical protein [Streptomyces sp. FBKL.4005]MYU28658.1 hypothetical protein [Streptomyces sp. SID7810]OYP17052.1 hypothetical protein CFC35_23190 [Streptomyces sp. FBKL.4005]CUW29697.1 hypothetical protein TUE45_04406 [Streptomyces reticuli]